MQEIQCYICGIYGHLCCKEYGDPGPKELSCYRCGLSGHTGLVSLIYIKCDLGQITGIVDHIRRHTFIGLKFESSFGVVAFTV